MTDAMERGTIRRSPIHREVNGSFLADRARWIRAETIRLISIAKSGHYTSIFSAAEILSVLYYHAMHIKRGEPTWRYRDRLVLSKGHVAVGVYPILADLDFFPGDWLDTYTRVGSPLGDHPDMRRVPGIDFSAGSLGHGLSIGVGMACGARRLPDLVDVRVFVLLGDAECNEGQIWEAAQAASHYGLGNCVGIIDRNGMDLDGPTEEVMTIEPLAERWRAFGWGVVEVDGHDVEALVGVFDALPPPGSNQPMMIIAHTIKGKGIEYMERSREWHLGFLAEDDAASALRELGYED
jgi:transketolase